jgi:mannose-6-phosphate isomerase-like protein (cupin superfamily)
MAQGVTHTRIEDLDAITGMLEGVSMYQARAGLGVSSFGISIVELEPGAEAYPEHDHSPEGMGGRMFAKRPGQLGQEEVYFALRGSGIVVADGEELPLDPDHVVRLAPEVTRKVLPGPEGLRLLAIGGVPGEAYDSGDSLS